jgi:hypothetical protein
MKSLTHMSVGSRRDEHLDVYLSAFNTNNINVRSVS